MHQYLPTLDVFVLVTLFEDNQLLICGRHLGEGTLIMLT